MAELSAQGPALISHPTTEVRTSNSPMFTSGNPPCGQRARDYQGNEYLYVKFADINYAGGWVVIDGSFNAARVTNSSRGAVGVCCTTVAVNDYGWVQIYGVASTQIKDSEATSAYGLLAPAGASTEPSLSVTSSLRTSVVSGLMDNPVLGAFPMAAATTDTTNVSSAHSGVLISVFLNFPYLAGMSQERGGST